MYTFKLCIIRRKESFTYNSNRGKIYIKTEKLVSDLRSVQVNQIFMWNILRGIRSISIFNTVMKCTKQVMFLHGINGCYCYTALYSSAFSSGLSQALNKISFLKDVNAYTSVTALIATVSVFPLVLFEK